MSNAIAPYAMTFVVMVTICVIAWLSWVLYKRYRERAQEQQTVESLLSQEMEFQHVDAKVTLRTRWDKFWGEAMKSAGVARYQEDDQKAKAGRHVLIAGVVIGVVMFFISKNIVLALVTPVMLLFVLAVVTRTKGNNQSGRIDALLPGFLSALKSQLNASTTPERALMRVSETMPSPLYEDLQIAHRRLEANDTFREALEELSRKTSSRQLQFMCACLIQSSLSGTNVTGQIERIQEVLVSYQKSKDETTRAVKSSRPVVMVATLALPVLFIFSYVSSPESPNFWFKDPISWAAIGIALVLYGIGLFRVKREADKVKNLMN